MNGGGGGRGRGERGGREGEGGGGRRRGGEEEGEEGREVTFSTIYICSRSKKMIAKSRVLQCLNYFRRLL